MRCSTGDTRSVWHDHVRLVPLATLAAQRTQQRRVPAQVPPCIRPRTTPLGTPTLLSPASCCVRCQCRVYAATTRRWACLHSVEHLPLRSRGKNRASSAPSPLSFRCVPRLRCGAADYVLLFQGREGPGPGRHAPCRLACAWAGAEHSAGQHATMHWVQPEHGPRAGGPSSPEPCRCHPSSSWQSTANSSAMQLALADPGSAGPVRPAQSQRHRYSQLTAGHAYWPWEVHRGLPGLEVLL